MPAWWKQLQPYLLILSLIGCFWLGRQLYERDSELNQVTWGNYVDRVWQHTAWAESDIAPQNGNPLAAPGPLVSLQLAREDIEALRSLPHYSERMTFDDVRTLDQFLRYASEAYQAALKEQTESGTVSTESVQRLARAKEGLYFVITHQERTNELKSSRNPWNHRAWRAVWADIAQGLRQMDFLPLPE